MELTVDFSFSAAHRLPRHPGACRRMHGHNYLLRVTLEGEPSPESGMLRDFEEVRALVHEHLLSRVDHTCLNDLLENPTAENVLLFAWSALSGALPELAELRLWENPSYAVAMRRPALPKAG